MASLKQSSEFAVIFVCFCLALVRSSSSDNTVSASLESGNSLTRLRRSLYEFGDMISCATNRSNFDYADYGCWCGFGGKGKQVDQVDTCCYVHDKCYDAIIASGICGYSWQVYFWTYEYTNCTACQQASLYPSDDVYIPCRLALCACDSAAAKCFARSIYNPQFQKYDSSKC